MAVKVTVRAKSGVLECKAQYPEGLFLKRLPGARWDRALKVWKLPATPANANNVRRAVKELDFSLFGDTDFKLLVNEAIDIEKQAKSIREGTGTLLQPESRHTDAWRHQLEAYHFGRGKIATFLHMDMGTGKTKVVIDLIQNDPAARIVIILCPNSVMSVWHSEFVKHGIPGKFMVLNLRRGGVAKRSENVLKAVSMAKALGQVLIVPLNYEAAWRAPMKQVLFDLAPDYVIYDEIHRLKSPGSKVSMFAQQLSRRATKKLGLTGTMMPHSPMDVYAEFRCLDGTVFGTSFVAFRARYARMGGWEGKEVIGYQREQELRDKIRFMTYEVDASVLDLPEVTHVIRECDLSKSAMKIYSSMEYEFYAQVKTGEVTAANALVKLLRLRQITGGNLNDDDGNTNEVDTSKANLLLETFTELGNKEPVVVFCQFVADLNTVHKMAKQAGLSSLELSGRHKDLERWDAGDAQVLAVQMQAGGVGIDLTRARYCVYYSISFNMGEYLQSLARIHRPGQTLPATYIHLIARGTVDVRVHRALEKRKSIVDEVLYGDLPREVDEPTSAVVYN